ncbi:MAG: DUF4670 domain-containing protein [Actinomycetota bacterium]|nr:DUF4670 domain-containing protein [Actinomycetota bacterium]
MSVEVLAFLATVVFGLAGVAAAYYGYKSFWASREQLELAREQAAQVPRIELMEVSLHQLRDDAELSEWVRNIRQEQIELRRKRAEEERQRQGRERAREERERREHEERERQERRRGGFNADTVDEMEKTGLADLFNPMADPPWMKGIANLSEPVPMPKLDLTPPRYVYEGPLPDHFVDVGIRNVGRAAAYDVTGWLWFDKEIVEPVEHFAARGVEVTEESNGKVKVELSVRNEGGRLFPSHNDPCNFRIPVRLHRVADTSFEFEFTSPQGDPAHGTFNLLLASGGNQGGDL